MFAAVGRLYESRPVLCAGAVALAVLALDFATGRNIQFPVLYILPTAMAAWRNRRVEGYLFATGLPIARVMFHFPWHETGTLGIALVNCLIRTSVLCTFVYLIDRVATQSHRLRRRVGMLEGVLPICAWCKRIRNDEGLYESLEEYISRRSEACFSHGICPDCGQKLYPEAWRDGSPTGDGAGDGSS